MTGALYAPRRQPTAAEIKQINESLAAMERGGETGAVSASAAGKPAAANND
jgi:hypothetical protein